MSKTTADDALDSWKKAVPFLGSHTVTEIEAEVSAQRKAAEIYPAAGSEYRALALTPLDQVKVVILGQDPYHGEGQADGLAFSVPQGIKTPPSLRNIFKEVAQETGLPAESFSTDLSRWATQGVLLLNTVLTVEKKKAASHSKLGWQQLTGALVEAVNTHGDGVVFMLWGAYARAKAPLINQQKHRVLEAPHPSPLSAHRGFMGCGHFEEANQFLRSKGKQPITW